MFCETENLPFYNIKRYMGYKKLKIYINGKNITRNIKNNKTCDYILIKEKYFKKNVEHLLETLRLQYEKLKKDHCFNLYSFSYRFYFNNNATENCNFFDKLFFELCFNGDQNKELSVKSIFLNCGNCNRNENPKFLEKYAFQKTYYVDFINYLEKLIKKLSQ